MTSTIRSGCSTPQPPIAAATPVSCEDDGMLILPVHSHRYRVVNIHYETQTIGVSDAEVDDYGEGCPRLHLNLSLDYANSWLQLTSFDSNIQLQEERLLVFALRPGIEWMPWRIRQQAVVCAEAYQYECEEVVVAPVLSVHKDGMIDTPGGLPPANRSFGSVVWAGFELKCCGEEAGGEAGASSATDARAPADGAATSATRWRSPVIATVDRPRITAVKKLVEKPVPAVRQMRGLRRMVRLPAQPDGVPLLLRRWTGHG
ncbi:hypothetical protein EJB05_55262, partial [Eragrostis curvula]